MSPWLQNTEKRKVQVIVIFVDHNGGDVLYLESVGIVDELANVYVFQGHFVEHSWIHKLKYVGKMDSILPKLKWISHVLIMILQFKMNTYR